MNSMIQRIVRLCIPGFCLIGLQANAQCDPVSSAGVTGFQEAVLSVGDLEAELATWRDIGGFEVHCRPVASREEAELWGIPADTRIDQVMLKKPVSGRGMIRLVKFHGLPQVQIRSSGMPWDTGGIFDLYMYVADVDSIFDKLRARGWQAYNDPVGYVLGPFDIREAIMRGPNGEALVLMQRNAPPYDQHAFGVADGFGWPFNSALKTADYEADSRVLRDHLGWKMHLGGDSMSQAPGENPSGLPWNLAQRMPRKFAAYANHPTDRGGSIQVIYIEGMTGKDFSDRAHAPNLGILSLRVPMSDLGEFVDGFTNRGGELALQPRTLRLEPYGRVRITTIKMPNGARIEFFAREG